jgi:hypothetical protein
MSVDTSIAPYYDDFDVEKNFHRILFKPGVAVQARELTQSQTILQEQIKRVGDYLFINGDKVSGPKPSVNKLGRTVRLKETDALGNRIDVTRFLNMYVTSPFSDVIGQVEFTYIKDDPNIGDPPTIVINLKRYNQENDGMFAQNIELYFYNSLVNAINKSSPDLKAVTTTDIVKQGFVQASEFSKTIRLRSANENIEVGDYLDHPLLTKKLYVIEKFSSTEFELNEPPGVNISTITEGGDRVQFIKRATSPTVIVTQDISVYYKDGFLVRSALQKIVPNKDTAYPTKVVGYFTQESIITKNDDDSLLDPALGSSNYFAEGADRLKIELNLVALDLEDVLIENTSEQQEDGLLFEENYVDRKLLNTEDFIPLIRFNKGRIEYIKEVTINSQIGDVLAERTYDESGSYMVDQFKVFPSESIIDENTLYFNITPGKAYVGGNQIKTVGSTEVTASKNNSNATILSYNVNTSQGNYIKITNLAAGLVAHDEILAAATYVELHNVKNPLSSNTRVGIASIKSIEFDSTDGDQTTFKMFYHYYQGESEAPASWDGWARKYNIPVDEGRFLSTLLYETNNVILSANTYTGTAADFTEYSNYYSLFREPSSADLAFWWKVWKENYNKQATPDFVWEFVKAARQNPVDAGRVITNSKTFSQVTNGSPFIDGLLDTSQIRSIIGVRNEYTLHGTSATYSGPFFYAEIAPTGLNEDGEIIIFDPKPSDALVFDTGKPYVKDIKNIKTEYRRIVKNASFSSGVFTRTLTFPESYSLGDGVIPQSLARSHYIVLVKSGPTSNVSYGVQDFENATVTLTNNAQTLIIDLGDPTFNGIADISFRIQNDVLTPRTKTLVADEYKVVNIQLADIPYDLGKSDIYQFRNIYKLPNTSRLRGKYSNTLTYDYGDIVVSNGIAYESIGYGNNPVFYANSWTILENVDSANYIKDNGQRDNFYDHGHVSYVGPSSGIPGNVIVTFDYFTHSGEGPVTVQSYDEDFYAVIPEYRSTVNARIYKLRDSIDFRPRRLDDTIYQNYSPAVFPLSFINTEVDITYYLGRIDRLYVVSSLQNYDAPYNKFFIEAGVPAENPVAPLDGSDSSKLSIATITIPPYTFSSFGVNIEYTDNTRYTMKDIGEISNLVQKLDRTVKIHAMQIEVLQATIMNEDTGEILVKSGVLIEDFSDLEKSDLLNNQFMCIVAREYKECFPAFNAYNVDLRVIQDQDIFQFNDIITMPFEEDVLISQSEANSVLNVNPGAIDDSRGRVRLSKKNSFIVNLLISGGALIGLKTLAEYAAASGAFTRGVGFVDGGYGTTYATGAYKWFQDALNQDGVLGALARGAQTLYEFIPSAQSILSGMQSFNLSWDLPRDLWEKFSNNFVDPLTGSIQSFFNPLINVFSPRGFGYAGQLLTDAGEFLLSPSSWWDISDDFFMDLATQNMSDAWSYLLQGEFSSSLTSISSAWAGFKQTTIGQALPYTSSIIRLVEGDVKGAAASATLTYLMLSNPVTAPFAWLADPIVSVATAVWNSGPVGKATTVAAVIWAFSFFSDKRLKEDIKFLRKDENGLNVYSFKYKKEYREIAGYGTYEGYIAQEVLERYPMAVSIAKIKGVEYYTVKPALIGK